MLTIDISPTRQRRRVPGQTSCWAAASLALRVGIFCLGWLLTPWAISGEDRVTYWAGRDHRTRATVAGTIVDYAGQQLVLRPVGGGEQRIAAAQIVAIQTDWHPQHVLADRLLSEDQVAEALAAYLQALREEPREWVQREILAQCVRCLKDLGRIEQAGDVFLSLVQRDPATRHFGRIPLGWQTGQPSVTLERKAQEWMQDSRPPAARLIGASWLLPTRHRAQAIEVLRGAAARGEASIAALAEAQLWRTRVAMADEAELQRWRGLIEQMPRELRAGPYFTLAQGLAARGQHQQAALAWMRVPILHADDDRALAAAALLSAAGQLERIGEPPQAVVLYREIVRDYAGTPSSGQARVHLERLGNAGG